MATETSDDGGWLPNLLENIWLQLFVATGITVLWLLWIFWEILLK